MITRVYSSQTAVVYFCRGFSCCSYHRGIRNTEVPARRELTDFVQSTRVPVPQVPASEKNREERIISYFPFGFLVLILRGVYQMFDNLYSDVSVEQVVCCRLTPLQTQLYKLLIQSKVLRKELSKSKSGSGMSASSLAFITQLKKLTNRK